MNHNDSEKLAGMLEQMGYTQTNNLKDSDLIIYNTCCVRENAELKIYGHLGSLKKLKERNPVLKIAICGCMMQQSDVVDIIRTKYKHVDIIFGTHNLHRFPELLQSAINTQSRMIEIFKSKQKIVENIPMSRKDKLKAWVTVMYGCDNFCTYCIVPYVRGRERSRVPKDILEEIKKLASCGCKEVTLLGQNVNSYGKGLLPNITFSQLLGMVNEIDGIERIRFMTSHPKDLSDELIAAMRDYNKVCPSLHLPVQSGSTKILSLMHRQYTKEQYIELVRKIKKQIKSIAISTDIIVGFPGETEKDFQDTLDLVEKVRFDTAYTFLYSKRSPTTAAKMPEQVPSDIVKERFDRLLKLQNKITYEQNSQLVGKKVEVLVEGVSKNNSLMLTGRSADNRIINFNGNAQMIGELVNIEVKKAFTWWLEG